MVEQAYKVFGRPPYTHYEFLIAVSENYGGTGGLEHRQSTEIGTGAGYFTKWNTNAFQRPVVPHEFAHVWNGKFRRPADLYTRNYNEPMQNTLLWVYEGQTSYWGEVLAARSGLLSQAEALDALARTAADIDLRAGRDWRNLQDTTNDPIMGYRGSRTWPSWQRGADYYPEGVLLWLDTDIKLRELSDGKKSLDDFARVFFAVPTGQFETRPYTFDELVKTLNGVVAFDWATFLRTRLDSARKDDPLDALGRSGWKLVFTDKPNAYSEAASRNRNNADFRHSLGLSIGRGDQISEVEWGSPAFNAKIAPGSTLIAVNGRAYKQELLTQAIVAARNEGGRIELLLKMDDRYHTVAIDYRGGLRYPHLERVEGKPDRLAAVFAALK
jgi:predicted metalloprotease with PDZ domain